MLSKALETNLCATKCDDDDDDRLSRCARQRTNDLNNKKIKGKKYINISKQRSPAPIKTKKFI